ncbi:MAG: NAD(P)/FAD-dependent oxidoreductase [Deltaproteobacteria bacterium]|nr:MAG: NAD(P)/FAD-dependent oxidoreductase [Deltaproteobacteria bacterium]
MADLDAVVIGSGPNGLAAAIALARAGRAVAVFEAAAEVGGGARSAELTLPGFVHDVCSAVHPMGSLSPFFRELPLEEHGLVWLRPRASVAHPMDDGRAVMLYRSLERTAAGLGVDGLRYARLVRPFLARPHELLADVMAPLRIPDHPLLMLRFGLRALWPATWLARGIFRGERTRALFAGCAAHSVLPLGQPLTSALGLLFAITAHVEDWPVPQGGSRAISSALASYLKSLGGTIETHRRIARLDELPPARAVLFDTSPDQLSRIAGDALPAGYRRRLARYRYGPGAFKLDWALDGPIPWKDPACREASTVHVGGTLEEIAASERDMYRGRHAERPFLILCQQSEIDATRAPAGQHTGYAYCHVPHGSTADRTTAIEAQVERFAPGFRDRILARHAMNTAWFEQYNPNYVGGAITGGVADALQLFNRPVTRIDPYSTPNPRLFICSAAAPPGGGVHGMCGYWAAQSALKRLGA